MMIITKINSHHDLLISAKIHDAYQNTKFLLIPPMQYILLSEPPSRSMTASFICNGNFLLIIVKLSYCIKFIFKTSKILLFIVFCHSYNILEKIISVSFLEVTGLARFLYRRGGTLRW